MMKRSALAVQSVCLVYLVLTASAQLYAEDPAKKSEAVKPPWQRLLQGADAKKAAEQEKQVKESQKAGRFDEALKIAQALAELRNKFQGADHWQAVDARFTAEAIRRVLRANKEDQESYCRTFDLKRQADALNDMRRYREAQPLLEQIQPGASDVPDRSPPAESTH